MLRPSEISPGLVDRLTAIFYDEIFFSQAYTILELHHSSVNMWLSVVALLLEGIALYAYGGVHGSETAVMAEAFFQTIPLGTKVALTVIMWRGRTCVCTSGRHSGVFQLTV